MDKWMKKSMNYSLRIQAGMAEKAVRAKLS